MLNNTIFTLSPSFVELHPNIW